MKTCGWCAARADLTLVGCHEAGAGPGRASYACQTCMDRWGILPLSEHPRCSLGGVRYREAVR